MRFHLFSLKILLPALLCLHSLQLFAGGPLVIEGPAGHTPVTYANPNIVLNLDLGPLGSRPKADADVLILDAFALWNNVSTSTITLTKGANLNFDVDSSNFQSVLPPPNSIQNSNLHENDGLNPIVYDSDGSIIDAFFGVGASTQTVGFAASIIFVGQSHFTEGYAVINGRDLPGLTPLDFKLLVAHELGHLFGLDHTQANINNNESQFSTPGICQTAAPNDYPLMYPFICRNSESLHADDISAVSTLYPSANITQQYGAISGFLVDTAGKAILGANVWAENTTTGDVISTVTDYLKKGDGSYLLVVPPGNYIIHANSINPMFNGGSGIGPYTRNAFDLSFQTPHPITPITYQGITLGSNEIISISNNDVINLQITEDGSGTTQSVIPNALANVLPIAPTSSSGGSSSGGSSSSGGGGSGAFSPLSLTFLLMSLLFTRRKFQFKPFRSIQ